jgi:hypothetical protein
MMDAVCVLLQQQEAINKDNKDNRQNAVARMFISLRWRNERIYSLLFS